jgi:hypothetical protein
MRQIENHVKSDDSVARFWNHVKATLLLAEHERYESKEMAVTSSTATQGVPLAGD